MITNNQDFIQAFKNPTRFINARLVIGETVINREHIETIVVNAGSIIEQNFAIGSTFMNSLSVHLSGVHNINANNEVLLQLGIKVDDDFEFVNYGRYYVSSDISKNTDTLKTTFTAYDAFAFLSAPYETTLEYPNTPQAIVDEISNQANIVIDASTLPNIQIPKTDKKTIREVIGDLAMLLGGYAYFDKANNNLKFKRLVEVDFQINTTEYAQAGLTKKNELFSLQGIKNVFSRTEINSVLVQEGYEDIDENDNTVWVPDEYEDQEEDVEITVIPGDSNIDFEIGNQMSVSNPYLTQEAIDTLWNYLKTIEFYPFDLNWRGNPSVEAGDIIQVQGRDGEPFLAPILSMTITYSGGLVSTITSTPDNQSSDTYGAPNPIATMIDNKIRFVKRRLEQKLKVVTESANGRNMVYYYTDEPTDAKVGDVWYTLNDLQNATLLYVYRENGGWTLEDTVETTNLISVNAANIVANNLAAISANLGNVTAGTLNGYRMYIDLTNGLYQSYSMASASDYSLIGASAYFQNGTSKNTTELVNGDVTSRLTGATDVYAKLSAATFRMKNIGLEGYLSLNAASDLKGINLYSTNNIYLLSGNEAYVQTKSASRQELVQDTTYTVIPPTTVTDEDGNTWVEGGSTSSSTSNSYVTIGVGGVSKHKFDANGDFTSIRDVRAPGWVYTNRVKNYDGSVLYLRGGGTAEARIDQNGDVWAGRDLRTQSYSNGTYSGFFSPHGGTGTTQQLRFIANSKTSWIDSSGDFHSARDVRPGGNIYWPNKAYTYNGNGYIGFRLSAMPAHSTSVKRFEIRGGASNYYAFNGFHTMGSNDGGGTYFKKDTRSDQTADSYYEDVYYKAAHAHSAHSAKENFSNVSEEELLQRLLRTDIVEYNFKHEDERVVGFVINDDGLSPYKIDEHLFSESTQDGSTHVGYNTTNLIGHLMGAVKYLAKEVESLKNG
jgi:negative regulator of replication initiation